MSNAGSASVACRRTESLPVPPVAERRSSWRSLTGIWQRRRSATRHSQCRSVCRMLEPQKNTLCAPTERERQTERLTGQRSRGTEGQRHRHTDTHTHMHTHAHAHTHAHTPPPLSLHLLRSGTWRSKTESSWRPCLICEQKWRQFLGCNTSPPPPQQRQRQQQQRRRV